MKPGTSGHRWALRLSSHWVAVGLLTLIFLHQAVGSAGFTLRQAFELNEMAWFNGPVSLGLWLLLCLCLTLASLVRIPRRRSHAGAHLTHLGVVSLTAAVIVYFSAKVESETILLRHLIELRTETATVTLMPDPGASATLDDAAVNVTNIMPNWSVRTGNGGDETPRQAWAVMVKYAPKSGQGFTATLLEGHPDLTQYTLEGRTPTSWLAEFTGVAASTDEIHALDDQGRPILSTPVKIGSKTTSGGQSLEVTGITPDWPLLAEGFTGRKGTLVAWTLRGREGMETGSSIIGEPTLTRFQSARVKRLPNPRVRSVALIPAPSAMAYRVDRPALWIHPGTASSTAIARDAGSPHPIPDLPRYHEFGTSIDAPELAIPVAEVDGVRYSVTGFAPYAQLENVVVESPGAPERPVLDLAVTSSISGQHVTLQLSGESGIEAMKARPVLWFRRPAAELTTTIIQDLKTRFPPVTAEQEHLSDEESMRTRLVFIEAVDGGLSLWLGQPGRTLVQHPLAFGQALTVPWANERITLTPRRIVLHPASATLPVPVPLAERRSRSSVGDSMSFVEVTAATTTGSVRQWVPYSPFPHLPVQNYSTNGTLGGLAPRPASIALPDGRTTEVTFSRDAHPLPGTVAMNGFQVPRRPGSQDPAEFFCDVTTSGNGADANVTGTIHMNHPLYWNGLFLFQSQWDPSFQAMSVLGVGNRPAGAWMLASSLLIALGMAWSGVAAATRRNLP